MSTITVELCGGNRKGIEKQDFDANKPDNENYITIKLVPEKYKLSNLKITVGLLNQDWKAIEADKYKLELEWSRVDMFYFSAGTVVKVVDTGDNQYYGYTKIIASNTDICDLLSIVVSGSKSGDFHQFVPYVVDDGLIGSSYEPPPFEHFASLIPGEVLWLTYRFRKSPGFGTVTTGYRAPGITGGTITDRQWYIEDLVYIYEVDYEGLTGWFFNSQCTVLNKGQWVFLNTDLATSLENEEDFSIPYGTELDNGKSFILPMRIQGHGPPSGIWYNQSKYYSNIRYAKAVINNIDRTAQGAYYICDDLKIKGSCSFYCQGPGINPESGDQFLIGDEVLLMLGGSVSAGGPYGDITIIGCLPMTIMRFDVSFASASFMFTKDKFINRYGVELFDKDRNIIIQEINDIGTAYISYDATQLTNVTEDHRSSISCVYPYATGYYLRDVSTNTVGKFIVNDEVVSTVSFVNSLYVSIVSSSSFVCSGNRVIASSGQETIVYSRNTNSVQFITIGIDDGVGVFGTFQYHSTYNWSISWSSSCNYENEPVCYDNYTYPPLGTGHYSIKYPFGPEFKYDVQEYYDGIGITQRGTPPEYVGLRGNALSGYLRYVDKTEIYVNSKLVQTLAANIPAKVCVNNVKQKYGYTTGSDSFMLGNITFPGTLPDLWAVRQEYCYPRKK